MLKKNNFLPGAHVIKPISSSCYGKALPAMLMLALGWNAPAQADDEHEHNGKGAGNTARVLHLAGEHKVTLGAGLTLVAQGMDDGDDSTDDSGMTYSADLAFEGDFGELGTAFIYINSAQGTGIAPTLATGVNADNETGALVDAGYSETRIAEAWYQFPVAEMATLTVGKIDPTGIYDGNEVANDETAQFLSDPLVNNPAIAFPGYTGGLSLALNPSENIAFNVGLFENTDDFSGALDSAFMIAEAGFSGTLGGRHGQLRLITWKEDTTKNQGVALSADQEVSDHITLMLRYGTQEETEPFDSALSVAGQWASGDSTIGAGYSQLATTTAGADDETHVELYYRYAVSDHIHVTADIQQVSNPDFSSTADSITVYGLRTQIDL